MKGARLRQTFGADQSNLLVGSKDERDGFPPLAEIRVGLFYKHPRLSDAGIGLVNHIVARLDEAGVSGDPIRRQMELDRQ